MLLLEKIKQDLFSARKSNINKLEIALLNTLYSEVANVGFNDGKRETTDAEALKVIQKFDKNLNECIDASKRLGQDYSKYTEERHILSAYLPKQLSEDQIADIVRPYVISGGKPSAMQALKNNYAGQYDGRQAATIVDQIILELK